MKKIFFIILILVTAEMISAQSNSIEKGNSYSVVKLYPKAGGIFKARNLAMINDSIVSFTRAGGTSTENMNIEKFRFVNVKNGNMALPYSLYGGALGLLSALSGISNVKSDPNLDDSKVNWTPFVIGFTAGFGLIGGFVGSVTPKWKRLYFTNKTTSYSVKVLPDIYGSYNGVRLVMNF